MATAVETAAVHRRRRWSIAAAVLWVTVMAGFGVFLWLDLLLRRAGRPDLALRIDESMYVVMLVSAATVGAVLIARRPRHPVGWIMMLLGALVVVMGIGDAYGRYGLVARPGAVPGSAHVVVLTDTFWAWTACVSFILLLTPTGSLPTPRWRWWARVAAAAPFVGYLSVLGAEELWYETYTVVNPFYVPALAPLQALGLPLVGATLLGLAAGGASLVVRFRRAEGVERQQLRWVAAAGSLAVVAVPTALVGIGLGNGLIVGLGVVGYAAVLCLAIGAAILRYRLYDLDRIVSRTVTYGLLSLLLAGAYAGMVLTLGRLVDLRGSDLVVALATLAVAALFRPAHRRIQVLVDRRFNRRRYDAIRIVEAFSARLRDEIDLDPLADELVDVVRRTVQPTRASLWLGRRAGPAGTL